MPVNLASPGVLVREVDLTVGRVDSTSGAIGAIAAPFSKGPIGVPVLVQSESDLIKYFGEPKGTDKNYESWMVASSFLAYGGNLRVVRVGSDDFQNSTNNGATLTINSYEDYVNKQYDETPFASVIASKNSGSWSNGVRVAILDSFADQIITLDSADNAYTAGRIVKQTLSGKKDPTLPYGSQGLSGNLVGMITKVDGTDVYVKVLYKDDGTTKTNVDYAPSSPYSFNSTSNISVFSISGTDHTAASENDGVDSVSDWFSSQRYNVNDTLTALWSESVSRPGTSEYASERGSRFDEIHVLVIDADGQVSGNRGTILEKFTNLSKAKGAQFSSGSPSYWRSYIADNSEYIFAGSSGTAVTSGLKSDGSLDSGTNTAWNVAVSGQNYKVSEPQNLKLSGGQNYDGESDNSASTSLTADVGDIIAAYDLFKNTENYEVDFLLMGTGNYANIEDAQSVANKIIEVAETRKDAVAFISPWRKSFITDTSAGEVTIENEETVTNNLLAYYAPITSSTYAVFDSGYKYMYDRFAKTYRYIPLNGDIAGLCARNDLNNFPWFSPAGTARGAILNAVKLAFNPSKARRDTLYSNRINPVIFSPGAGIVLFGDKTGYGKASAFDRINVRRLFIYLEDAISAAAKDQLFEFNDEITRTNFVNIVEPFLRDVQAKRGIQDYVVVCDESNNTAAVIDNNEFVADIYIKPARSINFIGLTFVATRTGVAFEEVIGNV